MYRILVINPGSTSSKIALFEDEQQVFIAHVDHAADELVRCRRLMEQYPLRRDAVLSTLAASGYTVSDLSAVVGRGGLLRPIPSGTYRVTRRMLDELLASAEREHVSNLGALIAHEIASSVGVAAFVVDPVCVDEFEQVARVTGLPSLQRRSESHALNIKEVARRAAAALETEYEQLNLVVAHLGGGISVTAHRRGAMIDVNQGLDGGGPFSPERAGGLPMGDVMRMAFSGRYTYEAMFHLVTRQAGLLAHLGTNDAREVELRISAGDAHARLVYEAMSYQIAKEIGLMATVLKGDVQGIALTGGLAQSDLLVGWIRERVEWIAPVLLFPGEHEMIAMARGALRVLYGEEQAREY